MLAAVGDQFRRSRVGLKSLFGRLGPLALVPYRGYGTNDLINIKGRVVEDKPFRPARETDTPLDDLKNMYRRFTRMPVPSARVEASFRGQKLEAVTDTKGYFEFNFTPMNTVSHLWHDVGFRLLAPNQGGAPVRNQGKVLVPPDNARHAIVSDIDDTVLPTHATNFLRMMKSIYTGSARTRLPFSGVAAFYRALHLGPDDEPLSPLFYVSRGPWNLYELLSEFFALHDIPVGPVLFLRDWGVSREGLSPASPKGHKYELVSSMIESYPSLPFILIGDSGQKDPEIYAEVVRDYPGRVKAVYIREITHEPERIEAIHKLSLELGRSGSSLILADDTLQMARHALKRGWIEERHIGDIIGEKETAEEPPSLLEEE
jgi:phosphatidate phosphatase APP1